MKKKDLLFTLALILLAGGLIWELINNSKKQTYYIDITKLLASFEMKIEIEKRIEAEYAYLKSISDSLEIVNASPNLKEETLTKIQQLDNKVKEGDNHIWNRLNPLLQEFGKQKKVDFILGANGMGSILYASDQVDLTQEAIQYVNSNYNGK